MYSTVANLRANIMEIDAAKHAVLTDAWCNAVIAKADRWVRLKVQPLLASTIPNTAIPTCPEAITELSEARACYLALVRMYSAARTPGQATDIKLWQDEYTNLLGQIERREVDLTYRTNLDTNWRADGRKPAFGMGKYGEYVTDDSPGLDPDEYETREDT